MLRVMNQRGPLISRVTTGVPDKQSQSVTKYCGCFAGSSTSSSSPASPLATTTTAPYIDCSGNANKPVEKELCPGCTDITDQLPAGLFGALFDNVDVEDAYENITVTFDNGVGGVQYQPSLLEANGDPMDDVTPTDLRNARHNCSSAITQSKMFEECKKFDRLLNSTIAQCVDDFLVSGQESEMLSDSVDTFEMLCMDSEQRIPQNFENAATANNGRRLVPNKRLQAMTCKQHCLNGKCEDSRCVCDPLWIGSDCGVNTDVDITLHGIKHGNYCDVARRHCSRFVIDADNAINNPNLTCKFEHRLNNNNTWELDAEVEGQLLAGSDLYCRLPKDSPKKVGLNGERSRQMRVSASNGINGVVKYSRQPLEFTIHHSKCNENNTNVCIIDEMCLMNGFQNPEAQWEVCAVAASTTSWTIPTTTTADLQTGTVNCSLTGPGWEHAGHKEISWRIPTLDWTSTYEFFKETWNSTQTHSSLKPTLGAFHSHRLTHIWSNISCEVLKVWPM